MTRESDCHPTSELESRLAGKHHSFEFATELLRYCRDHHHGWLTSRATTSGVAADVNTRNTVTELLRTVPEARTGDITPVADQLISLIAATDPQVHPAITAHSIAMGLDRHTGGAWHTRWAQNRPGVLRDGDPMVVEHPDWNLLLGGRRRGPAPSLMVERADRTPRLWLHEKRPGDPTIRLSWDLDGAADMALDVTRSIAVCQPNNSLHEEFVWPDTRALFPIVPWDTERQSRLVGMLTRCAAAQAGVLVFPELSVPVECRDRLVEEMVNTCKVDGIPRMVVGGSAHRRRHGQQVNEAPVYVTTADGLSASTSVRKRARFEDPTRDWIEEIDVAPWDDLVVHVAGRWRILVSVCKDLLNPAMVDLLARLQVNCLLGIAMSRRIGVFRPALSGVATWNLGVGVIANGPRMLFDDFPIPAAAAALPVEDEVCLVEAPAHWEAPGVWLLRMDRAAWNHLPHHVPRNCSSNAA